MLIFHMGFLFFTFSSNISIYDKLFNTYSHITAVIKPLQTLPWEDQLSSVMN